MTRTGVTPAWIDATLEAALRCVWSPRGACSAPSQRRPQGDRRRYIVTALPSSCSAASWHADALANWRSRSTADGPRPLQPGLHMHGTNMMFLFAVPVMEAMGAISCR